MSNKANHAGQFLYPIRLAFGQLLDSAYVFSKPLDRLDFDPSYPRNPSTLGEHIRKFRKDKGLFQADLARMLGVNEMTIVNWEIRGMVPRVRAVRERLAREVEGAGKWLGSQIRP